MLGNQEDILRRIIAVSSIIFFLISCSTDSQFVPLRKIPMERRKAILFVDFKNSSAGKSIKDYDGLARGIPDMVLTDFINVGMFRTIAEEDRARALSELAFQRSGLTENNGLSLGKLVGAELLLTGSFTEFAGSMSINARVINVETAESIAAARISGATNELLVPADKSLIKLASTNLLVNLDAALTEGEIEKIKKSSETKSIEAAVDNYRGEILLEKAQVLKIQEEKNHDKIKKEEIKKLEEEAREKFKSALDEDPSYSRAKNNLRRLMSLLPPSV
ncbi:MAG: hypothetical protein O9264_12015 [Leptospira sp.]|nr:hypothetical protein [Leptospira sp.]